MKKAIAILIFIILLTIPCQAAFDKSESALFGVDKLEDAVPDSARDSVEGLDVSDAGNAQNALSHIWTNLKDKLTGSLKGCAGNAAAVLLIAILCSLASSMFDYGRLPEYITLAGCASIAAVAVLDVKSLIGMGAMALEELSEFSKVLLPTMCAAAVSGGAITSASAKYAATALFMDILITAANNFLVPLVYAYIVTVIAGAALGGGTLTGVSKLIRWVCVTLMTVLTLAFTAYLSITGAVSGTADAAAIKAAKTVMSTGLPVVGGIISDAASSVVAGAGLLRSAIGVFGMVAVCGVCAAPFAALGVQYLLYKAAAACVKVLPAGRLSALIDGIGDACGMMLGLTGCGALMLFLSIISSIKAVSGL